MTEAFETVAAAAFERVKEQRRGEIKVKVLTGSEGQEVNTPPLDASSSCFARSFSFPHPGFDFQISRIASSRSSFAWPAASLNPAKLCLAIHAMSLQLGLQLFTHTAVYSVTSSGEDWSVNTSRGTIISPKVVHCTNAYSGALVDEVKPFVTPIRGESFVFLVARVTPSPFPVRAHHLHVDILPFSASSSTHRSSC